MKRNFKYIVVTALVFIFSACSEEFLEFVPEDQPTLASWYQNESQIQATTATLYGQPWFRFNDKFSWAAGDGMAGDLYQDYQDEGQLFFFSFNENNAIIGQGWNALYDVVAQSNLIINEMPPIAEGYGVDAAVINAGLGEARFMRAMAYSFLVEYWEEVPLLEDPGANIASGDLNVPKHTMASVYEFIKRDFEFAAANLPASPSAPGRLTSWSAKGMLAKLHVTLGQHSVGGASGIGSAADFDIAAGYASDIINNSGLSLLENYADLFRIENENSPESLFSLQWTNAGYGTGSSRQAVFARSTEITKDGVAWGGGKCMTDNFVKNLLANADGGNDLRRSAIFMQNGDVVSDFGGYLYEIVSRDENGDEVEGLTPTLNSLKKYVLGSQDDHGFAITNQDSPLDQYMLRLADVYLLHTEAKIGAGSSTSDVASYNAVRQRAGLSTKSSVTYEEVFNERRVEIGLEGLAWNEVRRRYYRDPAGTLAYLGGQERNARYYRIDPNGADELDLAEYELIRAGQQTVMGGIDGDGAPTENEQSPVSIDASDMVLPIPASDVTSNPLLKNDIPAETYVFE